MKNLITINKRQINEETVDTVSARELHKFLESKQDFSTWVKNRIETCRFERNRDYLTAPQNYGTVNGGFSTRLEYHLTLETAKHFAMLERNDKGFQIRDYFIECEKRLKERVLPQTFAQALRAYADEVEAHEKTQKQLQIAQPKAEYFDALVDRNLLTNFRDTAKELKVKQKEFISYLLTHGYVYRDTKGKLKPHAQFTPHLFEIKEFKRGDYSNIQTLITPKGRETFRLLLSPN